MVVSMSVLRCCLRVRSYLTWVFVGAGKVGVSSGPLCTTRREVVMVSKCHDGWL